MRLLNRIVDRRYKLYISKNCLSSVAVPRLNKSLFLYLKLQYPMSSVFIWCIGTCSRSAKYIRVVRNLVFLLLVFDFIDWRLRSDWLFSISASESVECIGWHYCTTCKKIALRWRIHELLTYRQARNCFVIFKNYILSKIKKIKKFQFYLFYLSIIYGKKTKIHLLFLQLKLYINSIHTDVRVECWWH